MAEIVISEDLRKMTIPASEKIIGCVGDKDVRCVYFRMPRYCDDTDLSDYRIQVHYINANNTGNYNEITDITVSDSDILFVWIVDRLACSTAGIVQVNIVLTKRESDVLKHEYNSGIGKFKVKPAFENSPSGPIAVDDVGDFLVFLVVDGTEEDDG